MRSVSLIVATLVVASCAATSTTKPSGDARDDAYLNYSIPHDAVRERVDGRSGSKVYYEYRVGEEMVGKETVKTGAVIKLELFLHGVRHGVQKEWHRNGKLKSASPFKNGVMHGWFKNWDEDGALVGCNWIENGAGTMNVYYSNGRLEEEKHYKNSELDEDAIDAYENGEINSFQPWKDGHFSGESYTFYNNGKFLGWAYSDGKGRTSGPIITVDEEQKKFTHIFFFIRGTRVEKDAYLKASQEDNTLPKFVDAPAFYSQKATQIKDTRDRIRTLTVHIPLNDPPASGPATRPAGAIKPATHNEPPLHPK